MDLSRRALAMAVALLGALAAVTPSAYADPTTTTVSANGSGFNVRSVHTTPGANTDQDSRNTIFARQNPGGGLLVSDTAPEATVLAQAPCSLLDADTVLCPQDSDNVALLEITPGDGDDDVTVDLGERNDAGANRVAIYGGRGNDVLFGSSLDDTIEGDGKEGSGQQLIPQPGLPVELDGGSDRIFGGPGRDVIRGQPGNDYLNGGVGAAVTADTGNTLDGGDGSDFFDAGATLGADRFIGGPNNGVFTSAKSIFVGGLANSIAPDVRGGDTVSYGTRTYTTAGSTGVTADLDGVADDGTTGAAEGDQIDADIEALEGTIRNDTLTGSSGPNRLIGLVGVDTIAGGSGGADKFIIRDGVRDTCVRASADDLVDADLQDPPSSECTPAQTFLLITSFTFNFKPVDETIPYVGVGSLKRKRDTAVTVRLTCDRESEKVCTGQLRVAKQRGGRALGTRRFRIRPGKAAAVEVLLSAPEIAALRKDGYAQVTTVSQGTSKRGKTSTQVQRRVK